MDGNFRNQSTVTTGGGATSSGDVSCSASVASSMESSVSSAESGNVLKSSLKGQEVTTTMTSADSGSASGEPSTPVASVSIETQTATNSSTTESNQLNSTTQTVEPINPFDEVKQTNSICNESTSSGNALTHSAADQAPVQTVLSPNRPLSSNTTTENSTPIHTINSQPNRSSPNFLSPGNDFGRVVLNSVPGSLTNSAPQGGFLSEDDHTEPSSAVTSSSPGDPGSSMDGQDTEASDSDYPQPVSSSFSRFIGTSNRRRVGRDPREDIDDPAEEVPDVEDDLLGEKNLSGSLICGYLKKLGRNGKWQTRWFETDGDCLSYYKNEKRTKLLATLDLEKVGSIVIDPDDSDGVSFNIQVLGRLYHLRTNSRASCKDWVITLNRIKEARMQQGNVKLVSLPTRGPLDLLDTPSQNEDFVAPRVVVLANRQRTRAVEEEQELNQLIRLEENDDGHDSNFKSEKRLSTLGTVVLARWTKRRSSLSRLRSKLANWARSLRRLSCTSGDGSGLDRHVHPPGHDDDKSTKRSNSQLPSSGKKKNDDLSGWIGKETTLSSRTPQSSGGLSPSSGNSDIRPRKNSTASENDIRMLS